MNIADAISQALKCQQSGQLSQAEKLCRQVLAADSMQVDAWHILGIVMGQTGKKELAIQYLKEALRLKPEFAEGHINLGNALRDAGRFPEAIASYQRCLELRPDLAEGHYNLGNVLKDVGKAEQAIECFQAAVKIRPNYVKALNNLGNCLLDLGRAEEAAKAFEQTVKLNPKYVAGYCNLGITMRRLGRPVDAVTYLEEALANDPISCPALNNLGAALAELNRHAESSAVFERLAQINPAYVKDRQSQVAPAKDPGHLDPAATAGLAAPARTPAPFDGPLISVVIPCYNGAAYLADSLECIRQQKVDCEIIVVNDGSTDNSLEKARELLRDDLSAVIVSQPNQGLSAARNSGLRQAQGKYVCFIDVDDLLAPDFCSTHIRILESDPTLIAAFCQMELLDFHRPVERWHLDAVENGSGCNIVMRTEIVRQMGGFPAGRAFRGQAGGEDCAFRAQFANFGKIVKILKPLYKYRAQHNSHLDFFIDRARLENGRIVFSKFSKEETDGTIVASQREYRRMVVGRTIARAKEAMNRELNAGLRYVQLAEQFEPMAGALQSYEGFVLYWLAKNWPIAGRTVEIGNSQGGSAAWLAAGCKEAKRDKVAAISHQAAPGESPEGDANETPQPILQTSLEKQGLTDWVAVHPGTPVEAGRDWSEQIRLLFLGEGKEIANDFSIWSKHIAPHGLVAFPVGDSGDVTRFYNDLCAQRSWRSLGQYRSLAIMERLP